MGRDSGRVDEQWCFPGDGRDGLGHLTVAGLPVPMGEPQVDQIATSETRASQRGNGPLDRVVRGGVEPPTFRFSEVLSIL
jgi:hypothetical protein